MASPDRVCDKLIAIVGIIVLVWEQGRGEFGGSGTLGHSRAGQRAREPVILTLTSGVCECHVCNGTYITVVLALCVSTLLWEYVRAVRRRCEGEGRKEWEWGMEG